MLSKEYKTKLNILIPYYRDKYLTETKQGKWQKQWFYTDSNLNVQICSSRDYCAMEKREKLLNDKVYIFAANKLGKKVIENSCWDKIIDKYSEQLIEAMNCKEDDKCAQIIDDMLEEMKHIKNILFYEEVIYLFNVLRLFFTKREFCTEKDFFYLDRIADIFQNNLHDLLLYYLFVYASYHESEKIDYVLSKYNYNNSRIISNQRFAMDKLKRESRFVDAQKGYERILNQIHDSKYDIQKLYIYWDLAIVTIRFDFYATKEYIKKMQPLLKSLALSNGQYYFFNQALGDINMDLENYKESILFYKNALKYCDTDVVRIFSCLSFCYLMLGEDIPKEYLICDEQNKGDRTDWLLYDFFKNYDVSTKKQSIDYLTNKVLPVLDKNEVIYLNIIEKILLKFSEEGSSYKPLYLYMKMKKNNNFK